MERTFVLVKPDGVKRGLIGEVVSRFEKAGLKVVALKMVWVTREFADKHYPKAEEFIKNLGQKTLKTYEKYGLDPQSELGTGDDLEIGKFVRDTLVDSITWGPVVAMVLEGNHAVDNTRMLVGDTIPTFALPGTIRGDFSVDSPLLANRKKRAVRNIVHASGDSKEAEFEISHWFTKEEIHSYKRGDEEVMFG